MNTSFVQYLCKKDKRLAKVICMVGPTICYVPHNQGDSYSFLLHEAVEQMLSVKAGEKYMDGLKIFVGGDVILKKLNQLSND